MATKTAAQLKAFFQTGDQPSQDEFAHLIDTVQPDPVFIEETKFSMSELPNSPRLNQHEKLNI